MTLNRPQGIGGSEIGALLGLNPYSSPYKLWLEKTGRQPSQNVDTKYTEAGRILESAVADFFEIKTGNKIIKSSASQQSFVHPEYPFIFGTPDRRFVSRDFPGKGILECKTTQHQFDTAPPSWFCQLTWYLGILGLKNGAIAWLERGVDFKFQDVGFDDELFNHLLNVAITFWTENVEKNVPPEPINVDDIQAMYDRHTDDKVILADDAIRERYGKLIQVKRQLKELETVENLLTDELKMAMIDAEAIRDGDLTLVTWKTAKQSQQFDKDTFKADHPEIYEQYLRSVGGSRRFLVRGL